MFDNPFSPTQMPQAGPQVENPVPLVDKWRGFLSDPNTQAALMSFGASLATPMGFGATTAGHISQAVGHAGKTVSNRAAETRKDLEVDSKVEAREAAANNATIRSQAAQQNADTAVERARIAGVATESQNAARDSQNALRDSQAQVNAQKVRMLELQVQLFPENEDLKQQLLIARTNAANRGVEISQQNADTRRVGTEARAIQGGMALDQKTRDRESRERIAEGRRTDTQAKTYEGYLANHNLFGKGPALSPDEWRASRGGGTSSPQGPGRPSPAPSQPRPQGSAPTQPASNIQVPIGAIDALRKDPSLAPEFDAKYGLGLSETYLGRAM
jgi:hypothetical protein